MARKVSEEIPEDVFFGVSKGIAYLGGSEEATEKAIMVDVDGELVPEEVIVESI